MRADVDEDVEVARGSAHRPGLAFAGEANAGAGIDPRRNIDRQRLNLVDPALAAALAARAFDHLAAPAAVVARPFDDEEALLRADLAVAVAQVARARAGARLGAAALARLAGDRDLDLDLRALAVERLLEADLHVVAQVRPAARLLPPAAAESVAEDRLEDIAEVGEICALPAVEAAAVLERGMAEAIISGALLRVLEALIGRADRLELVLVVLAAAVAVGMVLHRQLAVGGLDRRRRPRCG